MGGGQEESGDSVKLERENAGLFLNRFLYYGFFTLRSFNMLKGIL